MKYMCPKRIFTAFMSFLLICCLLIPAITALADDTVMYLCPRNDSSYTQVTSDGRVILGLVTSSYSGVHKSYDIKDVKLSDYEQEVKDNIYVNSVKLSDAMSGEKGSAVELQLTDGLLLIKIRYLQNGSSYTNPFGITESTKGILVNIVGGTSFGSYILGSGDAYYTVGGTWQSISGVKYAVPHDSNTAYYESNGGKFNIVFYIRNENGSGFGDINLIDADAAQIADSMYINRVNYKEAMSENGTVTCSLNSSVRNYLQFQFRIGDANGGNPFSINNSTSGTFRISMSDGIVSNSGYYIAPFDYTYDFTTKTFSEYTGTDDNVGGGDNDQGQGGSDDEPESDLPYRYLVPNSDTNLTYNVGDGRIAMWFNIRTAIGGPTISDTITEEMLEQLKAVMQINDIKISDAMAEDSTIVFRSLAAGQIQLLYRIKETSGEAHENPFGITEENLLTKGIKFSMSNGIELADTYYIPKSDVAYYNFNKRIWDTKDIDQIPEGPIDITGDYIVPRNDAALMTKVTNSKGTYYQLWFKAKAYITEQNVEDYISINGITISDAKAVMNNSDDIIYSLTNDISGNNYYIYVQCRISEGDASLNPFGVTGCDDIDVVFGKDIIIGNNTDFTSAKWNYSSTSKEWTKDDTYTAPEEISLSADKENTKIIKDGEVNYFQAAFKADSTLSNSKLNLFSLNDFSDVEIAKYKVNLIVNNRTAYRVLKGCSDETAFRAFADGDMLYLQFKVSVSNDGNEVTALNPFGITGKDDITIEFCSVFDLNNKVIMPALFTYNSQSKNWKKTDDTFPRTAITAINAHIANESSEGTNAEKFLVINVSTDKSVIENGGSGNFQAASGNAARQFRECVAFNGVTLQECFDYFNNQYVVMSWCRNEGILFWANIDYKEENGLYSIENYFGIDYESDFIFEIKDGLTLNGNIVEPCKWYYDSDTHTFTEIFGEFEVPDKVSVVDYNNRYGDGIIERSTGYQSVIRLELSDVIPTAIFDAQGITDLDSEEYDISANIRKYLYFDGLNLETWSAYRNSTLNTVKIYAIGSHIEIRPFMDYVPTASRDEAHWLEIKDGFTTAGGVKVEPIKLYYDPEKGSWEKVSSFDNLKQPEIIIKRNSNEYKGKTYSVSNPSWLSNDISNIDAEHSSSQSDKEASSPKTGDDSRLWEMLLLMIVSASCLAVIYRKYYHNSLIVELKKGE